MFVHGGLMIHAKVDKLDGLGFIHSFIPNGCGIHILDDK
jgi:hypothetical protein